MKSLRVDFVAPNSWRLVGAGFILLAVVLLSAFAWRASELVTAIQTATAEMDSIQSETDRLHKLLVPKATPRSTSASKAVSMLQFDVNKVFSAMENVDVAGTRLTGVTLDIASGNLGMEYVLEQSTQAQAITDALNSGYDTRPWRWSRVENTTNTSVSNGQPGGGQILSKVGARGFWQVQLAQL